MYSFSWLSAFTYLGSHRTSLIGDQIPFGPLLSVHPLHQGIGLVSRVRGRAHKGLKITLGALDRTPARTLIRFFLAFSPGIAAVYELSKDYLKDSR